MGTEVLYPYDPLSRRVLPSIPVSVPASDFYIRRRHGYGSTNHNSNLFNTNTINNRPRKRRTTPKREGSCPNLYAGSGFSVSPEPSALPMPSFSKREADGGVNQSATRDLLRILKLDS